MARYPGRAWLVAGFTGAIVLLIGGSLLPSSRLFVMLRAGAATATVLVLALIYRANRAQTRRTLEQLEHTTHILQPRRARSTVDDESRRLH